ncbi:short chain dehydrogenase [Dothidotthia symphoricarpi CBS 119687]|uniref:Short chain dehydrogenase n=1 Tax=Dothidotthia symphoricarpi CBS 119687 TaxID=1392245 RepID=A0A6A6A0R3_9PLEO|nr:short chain dehydrogenase [Dothidotthia symphoricarpi CBS 119687]KAF2124298.1 short chain dehydrogenase [Dothidotthia symphoricarpi CBS 119687]
MTDQKKYINKLQDTRVLVIGGSSGIGFAVAEAVLEYGAQVTISSSNPKRVEASISKLKSSYPSAASKVHGLPADLSKPDTLEDVLKQLFEDTVKAMGGEKLDHVIFTAGDALAQMKLNDVTVEKIYQAGQIRFIAPLLVGKFLPTYLNQSYKSSYTITTGSVSEHPIPDWTVVGSFAGGLLSMVRGLALDLKPARVNGVSPGAVNTELWDTIPEDHRKGMMKSFEDKMPTGRVPLPEDVAETYLGLLKDVNMDGVTVSTNGGAMLM